MEMFVNKYLEPGDIKHANTGELMIDSWVQFFLFIFLGTTIGCRVMVNWEWNSFI